MSSAIADPCEGQTVKGKGKARSQTSTERTPLLTSYSQGRSWTDSDDQESRTTRHRLRSRLATVFFASLGLCVIVLVVLVITAYSYVTRVARTDPEELLSRGLVVGKLDRVDVLNATETGGIWVNVEGRVGLDAGSIIGSDHGLWSRILNPLARWGIRMIDHISISLNTINVSSGYDTGTALASITTSALSLPLTVAPPNDFSWLTPLSVPLLVLPTRNSSAFLHFARDAWKFGAIAAHAYVEKAVVRGGGLDETSWRKRLKVERSHIHANIRVDIPPVPGLPIPGRNTPFPPFSDLVTLLSLDVSSGLNNVFLCARATVIDPAPLTFNFTSPSMPFIISLPPISNNSLGQKPIPIASVDTAPFSLTHPNITLVISGIILPLPTSASSTFSAFLSAYLSGEPNSIILSTPIFPGLSIDTVFPALDPKPQILRNVTIHDMKIKPTAGGPFLASGTIFVTAVLPKGMNIGLDVNRVLPDVLIFDGEVPDSSDLSLETIRQPDSPSFPDPLPKRAFGYLRPENWLTSVTQREDSREGEGAVYSVWANAVDIPMRVLPGREREFSAFVTKVIFGSGGALAGIQGSTAVVVEVHGLEFNDSTGIGREMELDGLPFKGSVRVHKHGFLTRHPFGRHSLVDDRQEDKAG